MLRALVEESNLGRGGMLAVKNIQKIRICSLKSECLPFEDKSYGLFIFALGSVFIRAKFFLGHITVQSECSWLASFSPPLCSDLAAQARCTLSSIIS